MDREDALLYLTRGFLRAREWPWTYSVDQRIRYIPALANIPMLI